MGFLSALKGFGAWIAREWAKIYAEEPKIEKVADAVLSYTVPALSLILSVTEPELAPILVPIINEAQKDLHVASGLIFDFGPNSHAASILQTVVSNLQGILDAGHIKNPDLVKKVTLVINTISSLATSILAAIENKPAPAPAPAV